MSISDDELMGYADGELDAPTRMRVEQAIAADPQLARRVAAHQALRNTLRSSFDTVLDEPVPDQLVAAARAQPRAASKSAVVIPLRPKRVPTDSKPFWGAIAASFVVGALVWRAGTSWLSSGPVTEQDGQLLASGALDKALSGQLVSEQRGDSAVQIGISFRSKSGSYCRTFQLLERNSLAGLACRQQSSWKLEVLARSDASREAKSGLRPAGSVLPPVIVQAVDQAIQGDPLDAQAEARARTDQWRSPH